MVKKRIKWIDATKGLCMLGIMYVHSSCRNDRIVMWILSFALPTFLVLAGWVQQDEDIYTFIRKIIIKLIVPCIMGLSFLCVFDYMVHYITNDRVLLKENLKRFGGGNTSVLWFVTALISVKITYFLLNGIISNSNFPHRFGVLNLDKSIL